jgi:hypothetical protein
LSNDQTAVNTATSEGDVGVVGVKGDEKVAENMKGEKFVTDLD